MKTPTAVLSCSLALLAAASVRAMDFANLSTPSAILLDGAPAGSRVALGPAGDVFLKGGTASSVKLVWTVALGAETRVLGDMWERTYGDSAWRRVDAAKVPRKGCMPWYFLATDGERTDGYGVMVQPNAFACWKAFPDRIELLLDVRAGADPVELGTRELALCRLVARRGTAGERPFAAGRAFCRVMCPTSRVPKAPVYGYNDWYCAYGKNTATNFLADAAFLIRNMDRVNGGRVENRPFVVVDDGWQRDDVPPGPEGYWAAHGTRWGMAMDEYARQVRALDARPGLWYRPLEPWAAMPADWRMKDYRVKDLPAIDPTAKGVEAFIRADLARFRAWGMEMVKIDFITFDWGGTWGYQLEESPVMRADTRWRDRSRTSAEVIRGLYCAMREAAGDMYIIGCNAIDHFAASLFELQRTGDDTDGRGWPRTRKQGPNTMGMRAIHNGIFYLNDGDCVGLVRPGAVPWEKNSQWLDLVARSGTALFTSWKRELATDPEVADALGRAWCAAARPQTTAEPLDWLVRMRPEMWTLNGARATFDWDLKQNKETK